MNKKFKETLEINLEATQNALDVLLKTRGSITDISEVNLELLAIAGNLQNLIERYLKQLKEEPAMRYARPVRYSED